MGPLPLHRQEMWPASTETKLIMSRCSVEAIHSSPKPDSYKIFSYTIHLSTSGGKQDVYSILLEALPGNIMTLLTMVQESYFRLCVGETDCT